MRLRPNHRCITVLLAAVLFGLSFLPRPALAQVGTQPRPAASYLHGPFVALHLAAQYTRIQNGWVVNLGVKHFTTRDRSAISRLVRLIDAQRTVRVLHPPCSGGGGAVLPTPGPIWLSFVRTDGAKQRAVYYDPCNGYQVNRIWLLDPGAAVWHMLLPLIGGRG